MISMSLETVNFSDLKVGETFVEMFDGRSELNSRWHQPWIMVKVSKARAISISHVADQEYLPPSKVAYTARCKRVHVKDNIGQVHWSMQNRLYGESVQRKAERDALPAKDLAVLSPNNR